MSVIRKTFLRGRVRPNGGATLIGYEGTVEFDWSTDEAKVYMHNTPRVETYKVDSSQMAHSGGDIALAMNFLKVMRGEERSGTPIDAGLWSALLCLKAKESAETHTFKRIAW
ncbi:hypothetical protein OMP40_11040 [Cohnella rhizosphaerae]|uniref:Uncharacterized protein n=1 Tax=Cohnella rhizosphaerae TaxID=1457232 RepID=A0A9X4KS15_9BACL|nr:hypothetical protein [Cohnella rhizosphaerae]